MRRASSFCAFSLLVVAGCGGTTAGKSVATSAEAEAVSLEGTASRSLLRDDKRSASTKVTNTLGDEIPGLPGIPGMPGMPGMPPIPPVGLPPYEPRQHARARLQGRGDDHDAVRYDCAKRS